MLIYSGTKAQFDKDVLSGMIGGKIENAFFTRVYLITMIRNLLLGRIRFVRCNRFYQEIISLMICKLRLSIKYLKPLKELTF